MRFSTLIVASITALLSITSVIAAPQPLTADVAAVNAARSAAAESSPNPGHGLAKRHWAPFCKPTGPGVCNFAWYAAGTQWNHVGPLSAYVYDRYCHQIGDSQNMDLNGVTSVWSQLPHSVVADWPHKSFWYAGRLTNNCIYYFADEDQMLGNVVQCAFDC